MLPNSLQQEVTEGTEKTGIQLRSLRCLLFKVRAVLMCFGSIKLRHSRRRARLSANKTINQPRTIERKRGAAVAWSVWFDPRTLPRSMAIVQVH